MAIDPNALAQNMKTKIDAIDVSGPTGNTAVVTAIAQAIAEEVDAGGGIGGSSVVSISTLSSFPNPGESNKIYIADDTQIIYYWDDGQYKDLFASCYAAYKLLTARNIELVGDVTGSVAFDGSADVQINTSVDGSFLKTETDPTVPAYVKAITEQQVLDWDTAFGWGDHSTVGYVTQAELDGKVDNTGDQIIAGDLEVAEIISESQQLGGYVWSGDVDGDFYVAINAYHDGTNWVRYDETKVSWLHQYNQTNNMIYEGYKAYTLWRCQPGTNPITGFTSMGGWFMASSMSEFGDYTLGGFGIEIDGNYTYPYARVVHTTVGGLKYTGILTNVFLDYSDRDDTSQPSLFAGFIDDGAGIENYKIQHAPAGASLTWQDLMVLTNQGDVTFSGVISGDGSGITNISSSATVYDNTGSGLTAGNVQAALDEVVTIINAAGSGGLWISDTAPANTNDYPFWWDTEDGNLYVWYEDADGSQWVAAMSNTIGASAYQVALSNGFVGTEQEWLNSLVGPSAYQAALDEGFVGTQAEWVASLSGKSAYEIALDNGFTGTEQEWLDSLQAEIPTAAGDAGKVLTNDGTNYFWETPEEILNNNQITWDLGNF